MPTDPRPLVVRHRPWPAPARRPRMANDEDTWPGLELTGRYLVRDGVPVIPVSGEMHYSRTPRHRWAERLRQMRAGGITVVAAYVFWIHHVEHRGAPRFDGNLDVAAFVDECRATGLDVVLRIGPWCHGEARNGGFPDWVQWAPVRHRTDDPGYLHLVRDWFAQLAAALDGRCAAGGTVLGIQLENELYDQPGHLLTLKRLARAAGMSAPLWTATAWGGADLPAEEVLPLYGGYGDGFWVDADAPWDPTFREHYFFSHTWDDPGIGADLRRVAARPRTPSEIFPPATCELGGGMATAYHRRPRPGALDVAAVAHCKIGNGSAWQGYYMYAGGTNPPGLQESHASGYPNDLQPLGYDFHAPIGEAGDLAASHAELRRQHAFLAAFGASLAEMPSSLPDVRPSGVDDSATLRWAVRSDGRTGFLFVAWHQPHVPLPTYRGARFRVALPDADLVLPSRPVDVPAGTLARWPLRFTAGGVRVDWVTASALTLLPGAPPTLVLTADPGIDVEIAVGGSVRQVTPARSPVRLDGLDVLVLPADDASRVWVCEDGARRRLLLSAGDLSWGVDGRVEVRAAGDPRVLVYADGAFTDLPLAAPEHRPAGGDVAGRRPAGGDVAGRRPAGGDVAGRRPADGDVAGRRPAGGDVAGRRPADGDVAVEVVRPAARTVPVSYGKHDGRQSAPVPEVFDDLAAVHRLSLPDWCADPETDAVLRIDWAGDVAQLRVDGRTATDRFWDGSTWTISLRDAGYRAGSELTLHLLPLAAGSTVHLPRDARDRLLAADGQLLAADAVRAIARRTRREA